MSEHTKEPWVITGGERIKYIEARVGNGMLQEIASCMTVEHGELEANARRIVACVNACAGLSNEMLENEIFRNAINGKAHLIEVLEQRDTLQAELESLRQQLASSEPVAWCRKDTVFDWRGQVINTAIMLPSPKGLLNPIPLYTHPQNASVDELVKAIKNTLDDNPVHLADSDNNTLQLLREALAKYNKEGV